MDVGIGIAYVLLFISLFFEVFMLLSFLESQFESADARSTPSSTHFPKIAVVVPCFNEEKTVGATMRSLLALAYPHDRLEIIVVDDGSLDNTLDAARAFESDPRVRVFHKENAGKYAAMNYALARTDAELIGCLDADSVVQGDALAHIVPVFSDDRVAAVTPGIHVKEPENLLQHLQKVEYRLSIFNRFMLAALGSTFITPGPFSIFRTRIVRELGGWRHGHSTEDMEMALRIQSEGHLIANAPGAIVYTTTPRTIPRLYRQRVRWTYGFLRNAADYKHMFGNRAFGNLGFVVLPTALISIGTGMYFFVRIIVFGLLSFGTDLLRLYSTGVILEPHFSLFYINTSVIWFLVLVSVALIVVTISAGSFIGTGSRTVPAGTPLFLLVYGFLAPTWLFAAVIRAVFKTGVRWR